jgi:hypothetical protein
MEWELILAFEDETKDLLRYAEKAEDGYEGSVLLLSKRALGAFPLPRPMLRVTIETVAEATPWTQ